MSTRLYQAEATQSVSVFHLPDHLSGAISALQLQRQVVISVSTGMTQDRTLARQQIRAALIDLIGQCYQLEPSQIEIATSPGMAPRLLFSEHEAALSISHDAGLSLAAIYLDAGVGVDLMRIETGSIASIDWRDIAQLYLGPSRHQMIASQAVQQQLPCFAQEWTALEARCKCAGIALTEWSAAIDVKLKPIRTYRLDLPENYRGSIAFSNKV
ncbi:4'-phosphopantetheinyl transferase superfamily protein [Undibacterium sp. Jales W-56]|uniref:4'-phosphopantetheinyl transferase family protein n=1 Tax=Undibacterium sp. Jales W-56 TaxID=2897325 RepID=UPI0021D248F3|nr:4'-phosphopantetheinyl transferase superfamily protein [Undibacterium sp. Jales W-56]MCU6435210.1 4'-phosphopantetheinyl transferase superfamily protein [Undibacterium sp. Jales W-56]